jgi:hypothetical protein
MKVVHVVKMGGDSNTGWGGAVMTKAGVERAQMEIDNDI